MNSIITKKTILSAMAAIFLIMALPIAYAESMPADVLTRVKAQTSAQYPGNFAVQKMLVEEQVKSYLELNQ